MGVGKTELGRLALKKRVVPGGKADSELESSWRADAERAGVRIVDPRRIVVELALLDLVPREIAKVHGVLPLRADQGKLAVLMAKPGDDSVCSELSFVTGMDVVPFAAEPRQVDGAISGAYQAHRRGERVYEGPDVSPVARADAGAPLPVAFEEAAFDRAQLRGVVAGRESKANIPSAAEAAPAGSLGLEIPDLIESVKEVVPAANGPQEAGSTKGTVLVVAPAGSFRDAAERTLGACRWNGVAAATAREVKAALNQRSVACVVLKPELSGIHGFEILTKLRGSRRFEALPVVVLSEGVRDWRLAKDVRQIFGVRHFLFDPLDPAELSFAVDCSDAQFREAARAKSQRELEQGVAAMNAGNWRPALGHFKAGLKINPCHPNLHLHLGMIQGKRRQLFRAIQSLERAHYYAPDNFVAVKNLAMLYQTVRFTTKAEEMSAYALSTASSDEESESIRELINGWTNPKP